MYDLLRCVSEKLERIYWQVLYLWNTFPIEKERMKSSFKLTLVETACEHFWIGLHFLGTCNSCQRPDLLLGIAMEIKLKFIGKKVFFCKWRNHTKRPLSKFQVEYRKQLRGYMPLWTFILWGTLTMTWLNYSHRWLSKLTEILLSNPTNHMERSFIQAFGKNSFGFICPVKYMI